MLLLQPITLQVSVLNFYFVRCIDFQFVQSVCPFLAIFAHNCSFILFFASSPIPTIVLLTSLECFLTSSLSSMSNSYITEVIDLFSLVAATNLSYPQTFIVFVFCISIILSLIWEALKFFTSLHYFMITMKHFYQCKSSVLILSCFVLMITYSTNFVWM
jgi:hypothetical protein